MYILNHQVKNFRNIKSLRFVPERGVNVVFGQNGQGKTNLLESIYLQTGAKSFRARKDAELVKKGEDLGVVESKFFLDKREQMIRLTISSKGRNASLNRGNERKAASLAGTFCCVLFSPEHLMLVKGSPEQRRRFIDLALCQISPKYLLELRKYTRLLQQKNGLLKDAYRIPDAYDMLDVYDTQMVEAARVVTSMRRNFCESLLSFAKEDYTAISGSRETLDFSYQSTIWEDRNVDFESGMDIILSIRNNDVRAGFCTAGPHRDDLFITLDGDDARTLASQGQQRSIVLALKLAEAGIMERSLGEKPVLLLDDVLSELDNDRQDYLIGRFVGSQTIITGCDHSLVSRRIDASVFEVREGRMEA